MSHRTDIAPSILDRLVEACAGVAEPQPARLDRLIDDIEDLLNTCCVAPNASLARHEELSSSLLTYGAPAPESLAISTHPQRLATAWQLQEVLRRHEPRLSGARVRVEAPDAPGNDGHFRIEAAVPGAGSLSLAVRVRTSSGRTHVTTERP